MAPGALILLWLGTSCLLSVACSSDRPQHPTAVRGGSPPAAQTEPSTTDLYLHGIGATANPASLALDAIAPTSTAEKYKDSPSVAFSGGNPWKEIGTWLAPLGQVDGTLSALDSARTWLGLRNSDDVGTNFDLRLEAYRNGVIFAVGEVRCIQGLARAATSAKAVAVPFGAFTPIQFAGATDTFKLRQLARIGTNASGGACGGHANAVGIRSYFDGTTRKASVTLLAAPATFPLSAAIGVGVVGLDPGFVQYAPGTTVRWTLASIDQSKRVRAFVDGVEVGASDSVVMNGAHLLEAFLAPIPGSVTPDAAWVLNRPGFSGGSVS
jgi:hypothetical protein